MPESIIVYRNPYEKALWESGNIHYGVIFAIVLGIVFFLTYRALEMYFGEQRAWFMWVASIAGVIGGTAGSYFLG